MKCCQCEGIEREFDEPYAQEDLQDYREHGLSKTSRMLVDALTAAGVDGATLLDIGGGVGGLQHALLEAGARSAVHADASSAYLRAAEEEAERRGYTEKIGFRHGDFVALAPEIDPADIVTLDRVICCYHDMPNLVALSAARARRYYGLVYPRDAWWAKLGLKCGNLFLWLRRTPFRIFVHPSQTIDAIARSQGLQPHWSGGTWLWRVVIYARNEANSVA